MQAMTERIIVTEEATLNSAVSEAVRRAMMQTVPDALREATAPEWMGREEVCQRYSLTPRQLTYMRTQRSVEFTQHGRRILYNRESLERWIEEGRVKPKNNGASDEPGS